MQRLFYSALSVLLLSLLGTSVAHAATFYVSPNGNDASNGSINQPFRTIQRGIDATNGSGGDEVIIMDGTYNIGQQETGVYFRRGTASNPTIIRAQNRWGAIIVGDAQFQLFTIQDSDHVIIDGLQVRPQNAANPSFPDVSGIRSERTNHLTVRNCLVRDMACNGIAMTRSDYSILENKVLHDNYKVSQLNCSGISIFQPVALDQNAGFHIIIRGNVCYGNEITKNFAGNGFNFNQPTDGNGIILDDFENNQLNSPFGNYEPLTLVENNLCFDNGGSGIKVFDSGNAMIRHNTCYQNLRVLKDFAFEEGEIGIKGTESTQLTVANNICVARNDGNTAALIYDNNFNFDGNGYLQRYSNILVGDVKMSADPQWDAYGDTERPNGDFGYVCFNNPTFNPTFNNGINSFSSYYRLRNDSPGINGGFTGTNFLGTSAYSAIDLQGAGRGSATDIGCYEGGSGNNCDGSGGSFADGVINVTGAPNSVQQGQTYTVNVQYSASTTRDVAIRFEDTQTGFSQRANEGRVTVGAGTGTVSFNITINGNCPVANNRFQWQAIVTEVGGWWNERKGDNFGIYQVNCTASSGGGGGGNGNEIGEVGSSSANANWTTVNLDRTYSDPVVIMGGLGMYGGQAATTRVRNVTSTSFKWRVDAWEYLDEGHNAETVSYLVIESGRHTLPSGQTLVAGNWSVNSGWTTVFFDALSGPMTVFTSVNTENEAEAVNARIRNVTTSDFQVLLQEEEKGGNGSDRNHVNETVGYLAIERGSGNGSGVDKLEVANTGNSVTQNNFTINFQQSYGGSRQFFLHGQTVDGGDAGKMRFRHNDNYTGDEVKVFFQEEQSKDNELSHTTEVAGYMIFDGTGFITSGNSSLEAPAVVEAATGGAPVAPANLEMDVFPNPNNGTFTLRVQSAGRVENAVAEIIDPVGRSVHREVLPLARGENRVRVDTRALGLPAGVYTLRLVDAGTGLLGVQRLVIR